MKPFRKLALFFFLFAAAVIVIDIATGLLFNKLYRLNLYGMSGGTVNYYLSHKQPDVLIMGSSRAHHNLIPDSVGNSCFNLSHNGMSVAFQAGLIDALAQQNALPKQYLILQLEPEELMTDAMKLNKDIQYLKYYYHDNDFVRDEINAIGRYEYAKYYFRSYKFNGTFFSVIKNAIYTKRNPPGIINGFEGRPQTERDSFLTLVSLKSYLEQTPQPLPLFEINRKNNGLFYLSHIIRLCKAKNIQLVVFTSPCYGTDTRVTTYITNFTAWLKQNNIPYLDYTHTELPSLKDPHLWTDFVHLNIEGAKIFSHIFKDDFEKLKAGK